MADAVDTIVLIHGLWMTPRSWDRWAESYRSRGYTVHTPAWPGLEAGVESLRRDPTPLRQLDLARVVDHYEQIIRALDRPPIIVGHSIGGTVVQILLDRGLGAAGVGVASATLKGVLDLPLSTLRSSLPVLGQPFNRRRATGLSARQFHYAFANTLTRQQSDELYERQHIPAANAVLFDVAFANFHRRPTARVDFRKRGRAPLLFMAFANDHIVPPKASRHNAERYDASTGIVAFKTYPGRPHFPAVAGWEEVADFALAWATANAMTNGPLTEPSPRPLASPKGALHIL
jgi:pimeloyl-ACP methyl ester carboxylesterase